MCMSGEKHPDRASSVIANAAVLPMCRNHIQVEFKENNIEPKTERVKPRMIGRDMFPPYRVYVDGREVASFRSEQVAEALYVMLLEGQRADSYPGDGNCPNQDVRI